jgi:hypothetical protein
MRYTNHLNLPQPLVDAVLNDDYSKHGAKYSITGLLSPPQIAALLREHGDEVTEDVSDKLPALFGKLVHKLLEEREREALPEAVVLFELDGVLIKAGTDRLVVHQQHLDDYKFVSLYKFYRPEGRSVPREYVEQMAGYRYALAAGADYFVKSCDIVAMYRDYKKGVMLRSEEGKYPSAGAERWHVDLWDLEECRRFLSHRLELHERALKGDVVECTEEERWAEPTRFAVWKQGVKKPVRVYDTWDEAELHIRVAPESERERYSIQKRVGTSRRCEGYCPVASFCPQWKRLQEEQSATA